jgi:hypothetical protein
VPDAEELERLLMPPHKSSQFMHAFVVESEGTITDFISFYVLQGLTLLLCWLDI